jgi:hypothetical protein
LQLNPCDQQVISESELLFEWQFVANQFASYTVTYVRYIASARTQLKTPFSKSFSLVACVSVATVACLVCRGNVFMSRFLKKKKQPSLVDPLLWFPADMLQYLCIAITEESEGKCYNQLQRTVLFRVLEIRTKLGLYVTTFTVMPLQ